MLSEMLDRREISSIEVTDAFLEQIDSRDKMINAYITVTADLAREAAKEVDGKRAKGEKLPPLSGIPAAVKDNICTKGVKTTCASRMLEDFVPCYDASVIEKLKSNDFVMLGKLNMDEFAMGSTTENSHFKITRNPADTDYVPGGSSGGSAAAVCAFEAAYTLGSDTGGSVRQPAAFCGAVGMKPTYGTVSRYGLVAFASSLDQIGPLTKNVEDNAIVLNAISGHDRRDATSLDMEYPDYTAYLQKGVKGIKIGLPKELFGGGISQCIRESVLKAAENFEQMGAAITEISMPSLDSALAAYYIISSAEASSNLARFDGIRYGRRSENYESIDELYKNSRSEGFGKEVKRRIILGTFALSSGYYDDYYKKAIRARNLIASDFNKIFSECDVILSPVTPTPAFKIGSKMQNPIEMYMGDCYTVPANIAGIPALTLPCGKTSEGLPIGMQLMGKHFSEPLLYRVGNAFETGV